MQDNKANSELSLDHQSLVELQNIILGLTSEELLQLQSWIKDKEYFAEEVSHILPSAVYKSVARSEELSDALLGVIENAIFNSVQNNPKALADALFPIMGPAIRQSISDTFRKMIQSLNETLEKQFSIERIKWRLEAVFSQKSYAEIVLLKGLNFKVFSALLIHKETGILIDEAHALDEGFEEMDMVSSMLSAIQDFIHDSFDSHLKVDDKLDTIRLNDFNVWVVDGPSAFLAIVFDGEAPESKREFFKSKLENIHRSHGNLLKDFNGEEDAGRVIKPILEQCIIEKSAKKEKGSNTKVVISASIIGILILIWISASWIKNNNRENFIHELQKKESIIVLNHSVDNAILTVEAMKDALSDSHENVAQDFDLDSNELVIHYTDYISTNPKFSIIRFSNYVGVPNNINIENINNQIIVTGKADEKWRNKSLDFVRLYGLEYQFDFSSLKHSEDDSLADIKSRIDELEIHFKKGESLLSTKSRSQLDQLIVLLGRYNNFAKINTIKFTVYLDNTGRESDNMRFALKRKGKILGYLDKINGFSIPIESVIMKAENDENARTINFKIIEK